VRYFFVDQLLEMVPGSHAHAKKNITITEDVFNDHFPSLPIYPGALLIESMAQVGGLLIEKTVQQKTKKQILPILIMVKKAKFRNVVLPGDTLIVMDELDNVSDDAALVRAKIVCDGEEKASAELFYTLLDFETALPGIKCPEIANVQNTLALLNEFRASQKKRFLKNE
jgi:3-hydroxyacyl-[acyl-carrier-protein] dehydratase